MKLLTIIFLAVLGAAFFFYFSPKEVEVLPGGVITNLVAGISPENILSVPESIKPTSTGVVATKNSSSDIEKQTSLENPPGIIKAVYITAWSAGSLSKIKQIIDLIKRTELNAVVIDIKDFSGNLSYRTGLAETAAVGAEQELRILRPNALIKTLHDEGIYVIARQTVFQDPLLARAHPEWALTNASTSEIWTDNKGLAWMDAAAKPVWDYNIAIAKDALVRGFDEINFDYIRFASDGDLSKIKYPFWDKKSSRAAVIKNFFRYLRENLPRAKISADLFGLTTVNYDDLGIGQTIESAYEYFDYISPMVYPSHYAKAFLGFENPAAHPYEIVKYSMGKALERISATKKILVSSTTVGTTTIEITENVAKFKSRLRPWFQNFDLGDVYDTEKVLAQIQAFYDTFYPASTNANQEPISNGYYNGWMLWDPANNYTEATLRPE